MYDEKIHAKELIKILESNDTCIKCPAGEYSDDPGPDECRVCQEFLSLSVNTEFGCPCVQLGSEEALKRSWIALEEKGYI